LAQTVTCRIVTQTSVLYPTIVHVGCGLDQVTMKKFLVGGLLYSMYSSCLIVSLLFSLCLLFFVMFQLIALFFVSFLVLYVLFSNLCVLCFCIVLCIVPHHVYSWVFSVCVQFYRSLPQGGHPIAVNKYIIISYITPLHIILIYIVSYHSVSYQSASIVLSVLSHLFTTLIVHSSATSIIV
jgi:hypothetical protein